MSTLHPYSRPAALAKIDGRTREAALLRKAREDLTAHVGGTPSAPQRALIERAAMLSLHLALMDAKTLEAGGRLTEHDSRQYLAWSNAFGRAMRDLGKQGARERGPSLSDYLVAPQAAG